MHIENLLIRKDLFEVNQDVVIEKKDSRKKWIVIATVMIIILVALDQFTKNLAVTYLKGNNGISIIPGVFRLFYLQNEGAAFGVLEGKQTFLMIITVIVLAAIVYILFRMPFTKRYTALRIVCYFLIAGAIGNMIDRFVYNYVVDFLYFELINFPIFNVADCYVTCSMAALFILLIFYYKDKELDFVFPKKKSVKE